MAKKKNVLDQVLGEGWDPDPAAGGTDGKSAGEAGSVPHAEGSAQNTETEEAGNAAAHVEADKAEQESAPDIEADGITAEQEGSNTEKTSVTDVPNDEPPAQESAVQQPDHLYTATGYRIMCGTPVNKEIAGILFVRGVGFTRDAYAASWFEGKGYTVTKV